MFDFNAPLFWYKLIFMGELIIAEGLATYTLKKRKFFVLRVCLCIIGIFIFVFLFPLFIYNALYSSIMFLLFFAVTLAGLKICYNESWDNLIFCGFIAYTAQHIAYEMFNLLVIITGIGKLNLYGTSGTASDAGVVAATGITALNLVVYIGIYAIIYWFIWAFFENRIRKQENLALDNFHLLIWSAIIVLINIVLSSVVIYSNNTHTSNAVFIAFVFSNIASCALAIGMQFSMLGKKIVEKDLEIVQSLWRQDKAMYKMSKENIELINIKCHDLKNQIYALRNKDGSIDKDALAEVEKAISIYDNSIKTGNDALDVIFAEKHLVCEQYNIKLNCIVDGEKLSFISSSNLYSLFGNAIQNAIEATSKVTDPDKRVIHLKVIIIEKMLSIHIENSIQNEDDLRFVDGLPQTTKTDKRYHGFGMRSIQLIAEKLGGGLHVHTSGGMFHLDIVIPLPKTSGENK